jgi:Secretion system C-terminal sorting domain
MRRYIIVLISAFITLSVGAQIKQEVIASAGGYNVNGGLSISWTLGETIIPTFTSADGSLTLTHGFQQELIITTVEENLEILVNLTIFPNPASDIINFKFDQPIDGEIVMSMIDAQGKFIKNEIIESAIIEKQINLQDLPAGIYYLRLTKGRLVNVYKVVKL